jgi:PAS domain S-box-containing protein
MPTPHRTSEQQQALASVDEPHSTLSQSPLAVFSTDLQGEFTGCSLGFTALMGYSPAEVLGRDFSALFTQAEQMVGGKRAPLCQAILTAASSETEYRAHLSARPKTGSSFPVQFSATLLRSTSGKATSLIAVVVPIGEAAAAAKAAFPLQVATTQGVVSRKIEGTQFILASPIMHKFMTLVDRVAGHTETVLVTGETGTGKELIARTIHESSLRRSRPWVDINCAALPENLVESELFGYEKGAFSGADSSKPGLFEMADRGTLFLDEIGELQLHTQVKLLRVLDGQPFYRLGGHRKIKVDVRIVAATNQDLEAAVREGRFRRPISASRAAVAGTSRRHRRTRRTFFAPEGSEQEFLNTGDFRTAFARLAWQHPRIAQSCCQDGNGVSEFGN